MEVTTWITYLAVISALIVTPGPSSILITVHGLNYGYRKAHITIVGHLLGSLVLMSLSALGLSALLMSSELAFSTAKYLGSAYLIYIGIKTLILPPASISDPDGGEFKHVICNHSLFKNGFLTSVSNPKDLVFFASLFPAFLSNEQLIFNQLIILMPTWLLVDYLLKVLYLSVGEKIRALFSSTFFKVWFNRLTGGLFMGFGVLLASYK